MLASPHHRVIACLLFGLLWLAVPARADAGLLVASAPSCDGAKLERPFLRWLDPATYVLAPDGTFSRAAARWKLSRATVVAQNEPYYVHGDDAPAALRLPSGSSATSPAMCVGLTHPTLRFFARNVGSALGTLGVDVLFEDAGGTVRSLRIGAVAGLGAWQPTLPAPILANLLPLLPGDHTPVAFRFTPLGSDSAWLIDDVYVDPYGKG